MEYYFREQAFKHSRRQDDLDKYLNKCEHIFCGVHWPHLVDELWELHYKRVQRNATMDAYLKKREICRKLNKKRSCYGNPIAYFIQDAKKKEDELMDPQKMKDGFRSQSFDPKNEGNDDEILTLFEYVGQLESDLNVAQMDFVRVRQSNEEMESALRFEVEIERAVAMAATADVHELEERLQLQDPLVRVGVAI